MKVDDQIIPRLLASTGRQKRRFNLLEIADDISQLSKHLGGLNKVSDVLGVSTGMLNKFLTANKLSEQAKELVKERKIDSVELVNKLARFTTFEQEWITEQVINGNINSIDIRLLSPLRKQYPTIPLADLLKKLIDSENKRVSVIKFSLHDVFNSVDEVCKSLMKIVGSSEVISCNFDGDQGVIKLTQKGEDQLRKAAKRAKKSLQEFTYTMLH